MTIKLDVCVMCVCGEVCVAHLILFYTSVIVGPEWPTGSRAGAPFRKSKPAFCLGEFYIFLFCVRKYISNLKLLVLIKNIVHKRLRYKKVVIIWLVIMFVDRCKYSARFRVLRSASITAELWEKSIATSGKRRLELPYAANNINIDHNQLSTKSTFSPQHLV